MFSRPHSIAWLLQVAALRKIHPHFRWEFRFTQDWLTWNTSLHMMWIYMKCQFTHTNLHSIQINAKSQFKYNMSFTYSFVMVFESWWNLCSCFMFQMSSFMDNFESWWDLCSCVVSGGQFCDRLWELLRFTFMVQMYNVRVDELHVLHFRCAVLWGTVRAGNVHVLYFRCAVLWGTVRTDDTHVLCFRCAVLWLTARADCVVTTTFTRRRSRFSAACARTEGLRRSTCCVTCEPSTRLRFPASTGTRSPALKGAGVGCIKLVTMATITCHVSLSAAQVLLASCSKPSWKCMKNNKHKATKWMNTLHG